LQIEQIAGHDHLLDLGVRVVPGIKGEMISTRSGLVLEVTFSTSAPKSAKHMVA